MTLLLTDDGSFSQALWKDRWSLRRAPDGLLIWSSGEEVPNLGIESSPYIFLVLQTSLHVRGSYSLGSDGCARCVGRMIPRFD